MKSCEVWKGRSESLPTESPRDWPLGRFGRGSRVALSWLFVVRVVPSPCCRLRTSSLRLLLVRLGYFVLATLEREEDSQREGGLRPSEASLCSSQSLTCCQQRGKARATKLKRCASGPSAWHRPASPTSSHLLHCSDDIRDPVTALFCNMTRNSRSARRSTPPCRCVRISAQPLVHRRRSQKDPACVHGYARVDIRQRRARPQHRTLDTLARARLRSPIEHGACVAAMLCTHRNHLEGP